MVLQLLLLWFFVVVVVGGGGGERGVAAHCLGIFFCAIYEPVTKGAST